MTKDKLFSVIRMLLSAIGAYFIGNHFFGTVITTDWLDIVIGIVLNVTSIVWTIKDKTANIESIEGIVRQILTAMGGLIISTGKVSAEAITTWTGVIIALLPYVLARLGINKSKAIDSGKISVTDLKK